MRRGDEGISNFGFYEEFFRLMYYLIGSGDSSKAKMESVNILVYIYEKTEGKNRNGIRSIYSEENGISITHN
jgi:hypothetical protein